ncbi:NACHT domain-containing protein, partial [Zavarzinella formosa]|uniref:NACHT domain-containing protein n=1 Tax=Zavarzinella formosa TaxID=360055 RepID=UPI00187DB732
MTADHLISRGEAAVLDPEQVWTAFERLARLESGGRPVLAGHSDPEETRLRLELLAELLDLTPRAGMRHLGRLIEAWNLEFPNPGTASVDLLREVARTCLTAANRQPPPNQNKGMRRALELISPNGLIGAPPAAAEGPAADPEAVRRCVTGLGVWFDQLDSDQWTRLPASVPGEQAVEISQIYVGLYAINESDIEETRPDAPRRMARQLISNQYPVVDVPTMLARTLHRCVVIGEPGSGKSTLVRWLAWSVHRGGCSDFQEPLVVKLAAFARALSKNPRLSLVEHFFQALGHQTDDWRGASDVLRAIAVERHRFLLLLDGWDEVPPAQRDLVRERIQAERSNFVTVITSRASGMPREFRDGDRVDIYRIAGLAESARDELVRKLLEVHGRPELLEEVAGRIENEPDLREMAANPFLLGLLVRVLCHTAGGFPAPRTIADVYRQVTDWVREQHNLSESSGSPLTEEHVAGLRRLSHALLFGPDGPRYDFTAERLRESMPGLSCEPVRGSRFVNRSDQVFDEHVFLHATLQEYFAAAHAGSLASAELDEFLDRAFQSAGRLIVLEFLAGQGGPASVRCRQRAAVWYQERDRYQQVALRLARLAAAGRWKDTDPPGLVAELREELWRGGK